MSLIDWAKREVEIACEKENPDRKEGEFDYGCACYESALKAFESLCNDGHSGFSIKMTQNILNRLINGQPLTPIEDTEDVWNRCNEKGEVITYQCARMSSLFKEVYPDGTAKYDDANKTLTISSDLPLATLNSENNGEFPVNFSDFRNLYTNKGYQCSNLSIESTKK